MIRTIIIEAMTPIANLKTKWPEVICFILSIPSSRILTFYTVKFYFNCSIAKTQFNFYYPIFL